MARLVIIFSIILSLFLLSHARNFDLYQSREDTSVAVPISEDKSDAKTNLRPLEQANDLVTWPHEVRLRRPIDRRFHLVHQGRLVPIRMPHGCRQARHRVGVTKDASLIEIPYGNDMIGFPSRHGRVPRVFHGGRNTYPATVVYHRNGLWKEGERNGLWKQSEVKDDKEMRMMSRGEEQEEKRKEGEESGFMKRLRGFLNRFAV